MFISLRELPVLASLSIPAGFLYIAPLLGSILMISPGFTSDVTLLESIYISSCVSHKLRSQVSQVHQASSPSR